LKLHFEISNTFSFERHKKTQRSFELQFPSPQRKQRYIQKMLLKCSLLSAIVERHTYDHQIASLLNLCMLSTRRCFVTYEETPILAYCRCFFSTYVVTVM